MCLILLLWLAGCGRQEAVGEAVEDSTGILQAEKQGNPAEQGDVQNEAGGQEENAGKKIPVDFPFEEPDSFQLTLVRPEESAGEYELRLYDKNRKLLQAYNSSSVGIGALFWPLWAADMPVVHVHI